ncbi:hypothetical protein F4808DRAFT_441026 [Astrocystis sublimbata]|nr:hypothetical protein F4808DRAFT_441026 [Astrocystis sublimbata]
MRRIVGWRMRKDDVFQTGREGETTDLTPETLVVGLCIVYFILQRRVVHIVALLAPRSRWFPLFCFLNQSSVLPVVFIFIFSPASLAASSLSMLAITTV